MNDKEFRVLHLSNEELFEIIDSRENFDPKLVAAALKELQERGVLEVSLEELQSGRARLFQFIPIILKTSIVLASAFALVHAVYAYYHIETMSSLLLLLYLVYYLIMGYGKALVWCSLYYLANSLVCNYLRKVAFFANFTAAFALSFFVYGSRILHKVIVYSDWALMTNIGLEGLLMIMPATIFGPLIHHYFVKRISDI